MAHQLPDLPYAHNALEPHIDTETMEIHHGKHHNAYVTNLNNALDGHEALQAKSIADLISDLDSVPEDIRTAVRNNGGGHANHSLFWTVMSPDGGGEPSGDIADAIVSSFGSMEAGHEQWTQAATTRFGSGWAWLCVSDGTLCICSSPNQDNPLMEGKGVPILGLDVWEHAYYKKYGPGRGNYIEAWWNVVDWAAVSGNYENAL